MKILLVMHHFLPEFPSGVEVYTYHLAQQLYRHHEVILFFATESPADAPEYSVRDGIFDGLVYRSIVNRGRRFSRFDETYENPRISVTFAQFLDLVQPDIAHVHHLMTLSVDILSHLKARDIPIVFTLHDFWLQCALVTRLQPDLSRCQHVDPKECASCVHKTAHRRERNLRETLARKLIKSPWFYRKELARRNQVIKRELENVTLFLGPSHFILDEFFKWGLPREKSLYSQYGHKIAGGDSPVYHSRPPGKVRFGFIGSIVPHKGLDVLLKAFCRIDSRATELHIFGGFYNDNYKQEVLALADGDSRVHFHGRFLPQSLSNAYAQFDVQVVPSIWFENSPITISEAFLNKTPVITGDVGGMRELVSDGVNGLTFSVGDPLSLEKCLRQMLEQPHLIEAFAQKVPRIKTIEENAAELEDIYRALANSSRGLERGGTQSASRSLLAMQKT